MAEEKLTKTTTKNTTKTSEKADNVKKDTLKATPSTKKTTTNEVSSSKQKVEKSALKTTTIKENNIVNEAKIVAKSEEKVENLANKSKIEIKTSKKVINGKKIKVILVKSPIGYRKDQLRTCKALGLGKMNSSNILPDNPCIRGMIFKVKHLIKVEEIN